MLARIRFAFVLAVFCASLLYVPSANALCDTGVSQAPCQSIGLRILIVAQDSTADFTTIQAALNASQPGDTIQVKDGVYTEALNFTNSGTPVSPITLMNYPGHAPTIRQDATSASGHVSVTELSAEWIIVEGLNITNGLDGIRVHGNHNTIRNNAIHNNFGGGILLESAGDLLIEENTIYRSGGGSGDHGISVIDLQCRGVSGVTIRRNLVKESGGSGLFVQDSCSWGAGITNTLVENNVFENNSSGLMLGDGFNQNMVRNNTIIHRSAPIADDQSHTILSFHNNSGNIVMDNIIDMDVSDPSVYPLVVSSGSEDQWLDYNLWNVPANAVWLWKGSLKSDFNTEYTVTSGFDANGLLANPQFIDVEAGDYHLRAASPARSAGTKTDCAITDKEGVSREEQPGCDLGAYEYVGATSQGVASSTVSATSTSEAPAAPVSLPSLSLFGQGSHLFNSVSPGIRRLEAIAGRASTLKPPPALRDPLLGLAAFWKFDEGAGTTATDSSGMGNTALLVNGPIWRTGQVRGALEFDGLDDAVIKEGTTFTGREDLTLVAWIKPASAGGSNFGRILDNGQLIVSLDRSNRCIRFSSDGGNSTFSSNPGSVTLDAWQHVAVVRDARGTFVRFFINGVKTEQRTAVSPVGSRYLAIGRYPYSSAYGFRGLIDEVRVYTRALRDADVQALYQTDLGTTPPPSFDFALSPGTDPSVTPGGAATTAITATLTAGTAQAVSFAASGLPTGATASASPAACGPTCATTLTIQTSASTPAGTYPVTVTGTGPSVTHTTSLSLRVDSTPISTGKVYYVAKTGNDTNPGTEALPWLTIQKAANTLMPGDTVYVKEGTYLGTVRPARGGTAPDKMIAYAVYPGHTVVIDARKANNAFVLSGDLTADYIRVSGFKFTGALLQGLGILTKNHVIVENVEAYNNVGQGSGLGILVMNSNDVTIRNSYVHHNGLNGVHIDTLNKNLVIDNVHVEYNGVSQGGFGIAIYATGDFQTSPFGTVENDYVTVKNSEVNHNAYSGIWVMRSFHVLLKGNYTHHNGATGIQVETGARYIVADGNTAELNSTSYGQETGIWFDETMYGLYQNNILRSNTRGGHISQSHYIILRNNRFYSNKAQLAPKGCCDANTGGLGFAPGLIDSDPGTQQGAPRGATNNAVVHNTFYDNGKTTSNWGGVATQDDVSVVNNNLFKNNIVANTAGPLEWANGDKDSFSVVDYNIYVNASRPLAFQWGSTTYNFANYKSASRLDANSLASDPLMTNPAGGDFTLRAGSPAIDRGDFLTRTTAAGSGTTIPVSSARYFSDGFGLVPGDLIQLEGQTQTARVLAVRLDSNAITVDRSLSWTSGVGVSYAFAGSKPDIGFSEVGLTP